MKTSSWNSIQKYLLSLILGFVMTACTRPQIAREVHLDLGTSAEPISFVRSSDGGFLMALASREATVLKLNEKGIIEWRFVEPSDGNFVTTIAMVSALPDGGALVCGARNAPEPASKTFPGFVIHIDSTGKEIGRLDPARPGYAGKPFYNVLTCAPWGEDYVISAMETLDDSKAGGFDAPDNGKVTVSRIKQNLSTIWSKPAAVGSFSLPTRMAPVEMTSGDLLFPSVGRVYLFGADGSVKYEKPMGTCLPVRSQPRTSSAAFVCDDYPGSTGLTIVSYNAKLEIVKTQPMPNGAGLPIISELPNGTFFALYSSALASELVVTVHATDGRQLGEHRYANGSLRDALADNDGVVTLRTVTDKIYPSPSITWFKN